MTYALRAEPVLTMDGLDILDMDDLRLLVLLREGGLEGAARALALKEGTVLRKARAIERRVGGRLLESNALGPRGVELIDAMELYARLLDAQLENLWRKPSLTCDGLLIRDGKALLVRRGREPFLGRHALPGGFVEYGESVEDCVVREVKEETGLDSEVVTLVGAYSEMGRDPRGHFVTLLFLLRETGGTLKAGDDAVSTGFFDLSDLPELAFDHERMIRDGLGVAEHHL